MDNDFTLIHFIYQHNSKYKTSLFQVGDEKLQPQA